jgi:hypothetical protein
MKQQQEIKHYVVRILRHTVKDGDICPHCGATGKYVTYVLCSDGIVRGAMRGCLENAFFMGWQAKEIEKLDEAIARIRKGGGEWKGGLAKRESLEELLWENARRHNEKYGITGLPEQLYPRQKVERAERTGECVEGREVITGTIVAIKGYETDFGYVTKMMVLDDRDFAVWGTMPSGLDANRGDRVEFSAGISKSNDDKTFGFFKRPAKAKLLQKAQVCEVA